MLSKLALMLAVALKHAPLRKPLWKHAFLPVAPLRSVRLPLLDGVNGNASIERSERRLQ